MNKHDNQLRLRILMTTGVAILLIFLIAIFSYHIRESLEKELQSTLQDVSKQNDIVITDEIDSRFKVLLSISNNIKDFSGNPDELTEHLQAFVKVYGLKRMGFIGADGIAHTTDGYTKDLSGREFYIRGMQGLSSITNVMTDSIGNSNDPINVLSVPFYNADGDSVQGVLFATYRTASFEELLTVTSFEENGYSCIIKSDGTIIASSPDAPIHSTENLFELLYSRNANDAEIETLKNGLSEARTLTGKFSLHDTFYYNAAPLDFQGITENWYTITIVPEQFLTQRLVPTTQIVNMIFLILASITIISLIYYIYSFNSKKEALWKLAYIDSLTGGPNYAAFKQFSEKVKANFCYIIAMDINEFKIINNICGVDAGDEVIRSIWQIISHNIRPEELAAHVSADRFVMLLSEDSREILIQRILNLTSEIEAISSTLNVPNVLPAFGIYPVDSLDKIEKCYSHAVQAKHLIKGRHDKNYAFYEDVDYQRLIEEKEMEDQFESALHGHQFEIWYQPKFGTDSFSIVGAEALVRWRKKDGTLYSPGRFIPLFEKTGMIPALDEYIFREVCRQQKEWECAGRKMLPVSVNISRASLYFVHIVERYKSILDEYDLNPKYVQLEITESATIDNSEISSLVAQFHEAGFHLLLDDFGNGYSSFSSLNTINFDTLKLDKSLIDYIGDESGEKLLYHVTKLAQSLGLYTTAEGVETKEQVDFVKALGCTDIQGFYFSKPLPRAEYEKYLDA